MIYATVAIIVDGVLEGEYTARSYAAINSICDAAIADGVLDGSDVEVWVLAHDHEPRTEDDCQCEGYLSDRAPYRTFRWEEVPA